MIDLNQAPPLPELFEIEIALPDERLSETTRRLVGFQPRYARLRRQLRLLVDGDGLRDWSRRHYGREIRLIAAMDDVLPLVLFHGDVGCGKTETAKAVANQLVVELGQPGVFRALSTRVRGTGVVAEMSLLINGAFDEVTADAESRLSFLLIDEADSLAETRDQEQIHHEDKVAVNTLIQRLDELTRLRGRVLVFLSTNRSQALDRAITRRAVLSEEFVRPMYEERLALLRGDLAGTRIDDRDLRRLARLTGPRGEGVGFTFSDLRHRLLREALSSAYPARALDSRVMIELARDMRPSPSTSREPAGAR
ncbi:MAG: AAA family ATPase [Gaiellaceae bacterium]